MDSADVDSRFLFDFSSNRFFDRFTLVDETGQRRVHTSLGQPTGRLTQQAVLTVDDQHDRNGIGARKVLGAAVAAGSNMTAPPLLGSVAANAAELMTSMPVDLRTRLSNEPRFHGRQCHGRHSGVFESQVVGQAQLMHRVVEL